MTSNRVWVARVGFILVVLASLAALCAKHLDTFMALFTIAGFIGSGASCAVSFITTPPVPYEGPPSVSEAQLYYASLAQHNKTIMETVVVGSIGFVLFASGMVYLVCTGRL